jgi:hypothetical protein
MTIHRPRRSAVWTHWAAIVGVLAIMALGLAAGLVPLEI